MAIYRNVQLSFWTDNKVEDDFTPEDKYFYLYLLTNPQTNICGCYEVSYSQMTRQTGYNKETIQRLLERFEKVHNVVKFSKETKEILILHWYKYNWGKSEKVMIGVKSVAKHIKNQEFRDYVFSIMESVKNGSEILYQYSMETSVSDTGTDSDTDSDYKENNINTLMKNNETYRELFERVLFNYNISDYLLESVKEWLEYKIERNNFRYKEQGMNTLLKQISKNARDYGDEAVANAISQSIASGYQGIVWDKVANGNRNRNGGSIDWNNV